MPVSCSGADVRIQTRRASSFGEVGGVVARDPGAQHEFDVVVIGSGFGGSVAALRLTEKGYRVAGLEAGRGFTDQTLPKTSWDSPRFVWAPKVGLTGMQRISMLRDVVVLSAAGVGGGSLVY